MGFGKGFGKKSGTGIGAGLGDGSIGKGQGGGITIVPQNFTKSYVSTGLVVGGGTNQFGTTDVSNGVEPWNNVGTAPLHDLTAPSTRPFLQGRQRFDAAGNVQLIRHNVFAQQLQESDSVLNDYSDWNVPHFRAFWFSLIGAGPLAATQWFFDYGDTTDRDGLRALITTTGTLIMTWELGPVATLKRKRVVFPGTYLDDRAHFAVLWVSGQEDVSTWKIWIDDMATEAVPASTINDNFAGASTHDTNGLQFGRFLHGATGSQFLCYGNVFINQQSLPPNKAFREALRDYV